MKRAVLGGPSGGVALAIAAAVAAVAASAAAGGCFRLGFEAPPGTETDPAACANFADDDGDGLVDCADPDCAGPCGSCQAAVCVPGFARCLEGNQLVQVCDASGTLFCPVGSCAEDQVCAGTTCVAPQCAEGNGRCLADGRVAECLAGVEMARPCGPGLVCDPAAGEACQAATCVGGTRFCLGEDDIAQCSPLGVPLGVVETCGPGESCEGGACAGPCTGTGLCEYLMVGIDTPEDWDTTPHELAVANGTPEPMQVVVEVRTGGAWASLVSTYASPGGVALLSVPNRGLDGSEVAAGWAYRVRTSAPASATFRLNGGLAGEGAADYDALPTGALGTEYLAVTLPHNAVEIGWGGPPEENGGGLAVIASRDGTTVTVWPSAATAGGPGIPAMVAGDVYSAFLNEGDVLQIASGTLGADLTGSRIVADEPVAVIAFHGCGSFDAMACDPIAEALPPADRWGVEYVLPITPEGGPMRVRAVGSYGGAGNLVGVYDEQAGAGGLIATLALGAGESAEVAVSPAGAGGVVRLAELGTGAPYLVAVFRGSEPAMVLPRPVVAWPPEAVFPTVAGERAELVWGGSQTVFLDGIALGSFPAGPDWEVATPAFAGGAHRLTAGEMGSFGGWLFRDDWTSAAARPLAGGW